MDEGIDKLKEIAFDQYVLLVAGGVFLLLRFLKKTPLAKWPVYWRLLPLLPECLSTAAAFAGAIPVIADKSFLIKIAVGLWCGYLAQRAHKVIGQSLLGDDPDIEKAVSKKSKGE